MLDARAFHRHRGAWRRSAALLFSLSASLAYASPATAQDRVPVDLELVLLADATGSIDAAEIQFQRQGYADALADPALLAAMTGGPHGAIALTYVEWADEVSQDVVVDWTRIDGPAAAAVFAEQLTAAPRRAYGRNAIGAALMRAAEMIAENGYRGERRVIDFSADSANNWYGPPISAGRRVALESGVTINGLAVLCRSCNGRPVSYDLEEAFREQIIGGPGAFLVTADSEASFGAAVRRKLFLEVSGAYAPRAALEEAPADAAK